jgi:hypothetical protein
MTAQYLQTCKRKGGGKEQASTKQKGSPRHFGTYSAASALKHSTCRGRCCVVKQLVSQKSQVTRVKRLQPLNTSRLPESGLGVSKHAAMAKGHHNLRADRQATTYHSTTRPRKGHDQMRSPTRRASRKWTAIEEPRAQTHEAHQIIPAAPQGQVARVSGASHRFYCSRNLGHQLIITQSGPSSPRARRARAKRLRRAFGIKETEAHDASATVAAPAVTHSDGSKGIGRLGARCTARMASFLEEKASWGFTRLHHNVQSSDQYRHGQPINPRWHRVR